MDGEYLKLIQTESEKNLADISRRAKENDPLELRLIPGSNIQLRVLGFINFHPVFHG
jgi:hypothetical protein